ncbi:MAG: 4Fe-4S binding protein [Dethiobacter sp.]|nr:4Fe-4S binding protein [Dethiobacter sp.]
MCRASQGCRKSQFKSPEEIKQFDDCLEASGLDRQVHSGPVLIHHKFRAAAAGCPNCCSEPQIRDFAIVAGTRPRVSDEACSDCGACVKVCPDRAITLEQGPVIDREQCLECGLCIRACPTGTLVPALQGVKVLVGGRLGRRPTLARPLTDLVPLAEGLRILDACIAYYLSERNPNERFSSLILRLGLDHLRQAIQETE